MIIVAITGPRLRDARAQVVGSSRYADIFEFRLDLIRSPRLRTLLALTNKPRIVTCRPSWEGGEFTGGESERFDLLLEAESLGVEFVDIERKAHAAFLRRASRDAKWTSSPRRAKHIVSYHHFDGKSIDVTRVVRQFQGLQADIIKFAYQADDAWQIEFARRFLDQATKHRQKAIGIAMGEAGEASRVLYRVFGGWATYASPETGQPSAPGQIPASMLKWLYRAHRLDRRTRIFGVIGYPLAHSRGMFMHNAVFNKEGLNAVYCRFPVQDLTRFLGGFAQRVQGLSVTIPHKEAVLSSVSRISDVARSIGAVNTLVRRPVGWYGDNTDAAGALDAIERVIRVPRKRLLIIGAGGTARALAFEARRRGADVTVTNRTEMRGRALSRQFGVRFVNTCDVVGYRFDVVMNATSAGMWPKTNTEPLPELSLKDVVVFDAVFNPPVTTFLRRAMREGGTIVSGVEMYLNQAIAQDKLFVGASPTSRFLRGTLKDHLREL